MLDFEIKQRVDYRVGQLREEAEAHRLAQCAATQDRRPALFQAIADAIYAWHMRAVVSGRRKARRRVHRITPTVGAFR